MEICLGGSAPMMRMRVGWSDLGRIFITAIRVLARWGILEWLSMGTVSGHHLWRLHRRSCYRKHISKSRHEFRNPHHIGLSTNNPHRNTCLIANQHTQKHALPPPRILKPSTASADLRKSAHLLGLGTGSHIGDQHMRTIGRLLFRCMIGSWLSSQ